MTDQGADNVERRRQAWTKESLEKRKDFLVKKGSDAEAVAKMTGAELVHACLLAEGFSEKSVAKKEVKAQVTGAAAGGMELMMMFFQQMKEDNDRRNAEREAKCKEEKLEREAKCKEEKLEREAKCKEEKLEREARCREEKIERKKEIKKQEEESKRREEREQNKG
jgi:hypothetical protein